MKNNIKLGWIGSGFVSQVAHLNSFSSIPNVEIVALSEIRDSGKKNCQKFGIRKFYNNYKEMIKNENLMRGRMHGKKISNLYDSKRDFKK